MLQWLRQRFYVQRTLSHLSLLLSPFLTQCAKWPLDDTAEIGDNIYGCKMTIWVDNALFFKFKKLFRYNGHNCFRSLLYLSCA